MTRLFLKVISMSILASWLILAVLILRFVLKKAPKWVNVLLWGIVVVRLVCPFSIASSVSLVPDFIGNGELVSEWMDDLDIHHPDSVHYGAEKGAGKELISDEEGGYDVVTKHEQLGEPSAIENTVMPILSFVWVSGMVLLAFYTVFSYRCLYRRVETAVFFEGNIFQSENVSAPFVLGIIKPKIYLPFNIDSQNLPFVIAHEQAHIRRKDHWWKLFGFLLLTIHWFNPLIWLAYMLLCRDIELACDEKVIKELGSAQRADYMQALVACSVSRRVNAACPLSFGGVGVKERVKSVMNYKKPAFGMVALAVTACVAVAVCFLTNPLGFRYDEVNTIASASCFDFRAGDKGLMELSMAQISELGSRLAGVKKTKSGGQYAGLTPAYQISALLQDGSYIRISGYSLSEDDMVDIERNGERYVVSDSDFQAYLSRICSGGDIAVSDFLTEANSAYTDFLSGNRTLLADGQSETWWIPDFQEDGVKYEFTYLDLNGDGSVELIVQMADAPYGYNGVFHFENGKIFCWNSDAVEMTCWDVPLDNGTMVRQYDTSGSHIYTVFRYTDSGEQEELHHLFFREQLVPEDSTEPCPYYEIDGTEMEETEFNERLNELVTVHRMAPSVWTIM